MILSRCFLYVFLILWMKMKRKLYVIKRLIFLETLSYYINLHLFESIFLISTIYNIHNIISMHVSLFINLLQTKIISKIHRFWVFLFYKITYCFHYKNINQGRSTNSFLVYIFMYPYCLQWADHKYWILFLCKTNFLIVWNCFKIMDIFFLLVR